jgi:hypothetical protein
MSGDIVCNTSTKRSSNLDPFDKTSKSGDGGHGEDIFDLYAITVIFFIFLPIGLNAIL